MFITALILDCSNPKQDNKQRQQKPSMQSYKTEIKILASPGLA